MNQETFNLSIRKFLKIVGINSQRAIEQAVDKALADGAHRRIVLATMTLKHRLKLNVSPMGECLNRLVNRDYLRNSLCHRDAHPAIAVLRQEGI
jgi:hypothetical protein